MYIFLKILHILYVIILIGVPLYLIYILILMLFSGVLFVPISGQMVSMQARTVTPMQTRTSSGGASFLVDLEYTYVYNEKSYTGKKLFSYGTSNISYPAFNALFPTELQYDSTRMLTVNVKNNAYGDTSDIFIRKDITVWVLKYFPEKSCLIVQKMPIWLIVLFLVFYGAFMHFMPYLLRPDYYQVIFKF